MRRMIQNDAVSVDDGDVIFGKNVEVDGKIRLNGAEDLTDKDGTPLIGGVQISATAPADTTKIIAHYIEYWDENGGKGRVFVAGNHLEGKTAFTIVSGKAGAPEATFIVNAWFYFVEGVFTVFDWNGIQINGMAGSVSIYHADETGFHHQYVYNM